MIRNRLFLQLWSMTAVVTALTAVIFYNASLYEFQLDLEASARTRLLAQIPLAATFGRQLLEGSSIELEHQNISTDRLTVIDAAGVVIFDTEYDAALMENHATRPEIRQATTLGRSTASRFSDTLKMDYMYAAQRIDDVQGQVLGFSRLATPLEQLDNRLATLRKRMLPVIALTLLVLMTISYAVTVRVYRPIARAARMAREIADGNYDTRLPGLGSDDTALLERSLNDLSRQTGERVNTLEDGRDQLAGILTALQEGVIALNPEQRILHINRAAQEFLGVNNDVIGQPIREVTQIPQLIDLIDKTRPTGAEQNRLLSIGRRTIEARTESRERPARLDGAVIIVLHDVTEQQRLEKVRADFVANASHELKTPLTAIRGFAETILDHPEMPADTRSRFVGKIQFQANRLGQIVAELLELSRFDSRADRGDEFVAVNVAGVVKASAIAVESIAEERNISIRLNLAVGQYIVMGDREELLQLTINLIDNAIKYSGDGSTVELSLSATGDIVKLVVSDQGPGIPPEFRDRIFERFYRIDTARSRELGGTGLGLSIVRNIAISHGGRVYLDSTPDIGASFVVELPRVKAP